VSKLEPLATLQQVLGTPKFWQKPDEENPSTASAELPSSSFSSTLIHDFERLYSDRMSDLSDVTFVVANQNFPAHKVVLAARSTYFSALFSNKMKEQVLSNGNVEIQLDLDPILFATVLKWIYTEELDIPSENVDRIEVSKTWFLWMVCDSCFVMKKNSLGFW